jgi:excinuclease ABC subunit A
MSEMDTNNAIYIKGARVNNLKNIDVMIPRDRLVVVTGLSGSGKSSLAFDTLYAEGQRRYVESLSAYARQFLGRKGKPECDYILGIPPAVAIEQKVIVRNPRSTVGTSTEIYDYLRLLFARVGRTYSPVSGEWVKKHTTEDVVAYARSLPEGTRVALMVEVKVPEGRSLTEHLEVLTKSGFSRAEVGGNFVRLEEVTEAPFHLVVDRMALPFADAAAQSRFADSVETAFYEGNNEFLLGVWLPREVQTAECSTPGGHYLRTFSKRFEADGITFEEPSEMMFNFNNPMGACPTCEGFGRVLGIDEDLVIPNKALSVYEDCVVCWKGEKMSEWKHYLIEHASEVDFPIHRPYYQLTDEQKAMLWHGCKAFYGIDDFFRMVSENLYKIQYRVMQARYRGKTLCPTCHGTRLKKETAYVKVGGKCITELVHLSVDDLVEWFAALQLDEHDATVARRLLTEIRSRLGFLHDVGLGYLTLDRMSNTLSGGESQRINLATSLGSALVGSMYILDEPSIGLHSRDTELLISVLKKLRDLGNTVVVVEHDEEIIRAADYLIDIGPEAGSHGGEVVFSGSADEIARGDATRSHTIRFLTGAEQIELPLRPRPWASYIEVKGAVQNNLKDISVKFPIGVMTVVTGVSGSGKSTLVRDLLYRGLLRHLGEAGDAPGAFSALGGDLHRIKRVEMVDQNPIGKSTRSNAATYMKAYDEIRRLYAEQPFAKQMGFTPATFSFNVEGGRCEACKGEGTVTVEMQFMADLVIECEECHGKRFNSDVLEVRYHEKNITDVLDLTVDEAIEFFDSEPRIVSRLLPLQQVGLGYIKLGQSSSTLSGGENQRVKLAYYLAFDDSLPTLFIFDEPTTGLHLHDVRVLLRAFNSLIDKGHTLVIIEHNLDVIKCADHIIDLGPEGGAAGGYLVAEGTPQQVAECEASYTGHYLKEKLQAEAKQLKSPTTHVKK